jgi:anti-sigma factor RsiW
MSEDLHKHARRLLAAARVEGISDAEQAWLETHMQECAHCGEHASSLARTIGSVRSLAAPLDPALVEATRRRVHFRARELREQEARMHALWMACGLSWVLGVVSAPLLWWALEWIGERIAVPKPIWVISFMFWWIVPAVVAAAVLTWRRSRAPSVNEHPRL